KSRGVGPTSESIGARGSHWLGPKKPSAASPSASPQASVPAAPHAARRARPKEPVRRPAEPPPEAVDPGGHEGGRDVEAPAPERPGELYVIGESPGPDDEADRRHGDSSYEDIHVLRRLGIGLEADGTPLAPALLRRAPRHRCGEATPRSVDGQPLAGPDSANRRHQVPTGGHEDADDGAMAAEVDVVARPAVGPEHDPARLRARSGRAGGGARIT